MQCNDAFQNEINSDQVFYFKYQLKISAYDPTLYTWSYLADAYVLYDPHHVDDPILFLVFRISFTKNGFKG